MRNVTYSIFNKYNSESEKSLLKYIESPETHKYFLILLNKLGIKNKFQQSSQIINLLGMILNKILNYAEKEKNYENAKNCIILSQKLYYYENNEKCYLLDKIRNHKWIITSEFWLDFIDKMISQEIDKFITYHPEISKDIILNNSAKMSDKIKFKLSELFFSQILSYAKNMTEFKLPLKTIVEIIENFCQKYNYLNDKQKESIYGIISNNKDEIENLRKECNKNNNNKLLNDNNVTPNNETNIGMETSK